MPVAIAAREVHASIDRRRIPLQHLLDQADALEELAPVERRDETQAADQIGHEGLFGGLMPCLGADRVLDRLPARRQSGFQLLPKRGGGFVLARTLEQPNHECGVNLGRPAMAAASRRGERTNQTIGREAMATARRHHVTPGSQVLDERELQRRRPRPQLTDRQGRDRLEGGHEAVEALRVEAARAAANQFQRHRIDARQTGELVSRDPREPAKEASRQIVMNVAQGGQDDVEIVEQPLGGGRRRFAFCRVASQCRVDVTKSPRVLANLLQMRAAASVLRRDREQRGQSPRMLFQRLNAEQFDGRWRRIVAVFTHELRFLVGHARMPPSATTTVSL